MTNILITYNCSGYSKMCLINIPFCTCKNGNGLRRIIRNRYNAICNTSHANFGCEKVIVTFTNAANNIEITKIIIN